MCSRYPDLLSVLGGHRTYRSRKGQSRGLFGAVDEHLTACYLVNVTTGLASLNFEGGVLFLF